MNMVFESEKTDDYLLTTAEVNYSQPLIQEKAAELFDHSQSDVDKAKIAFEFVRDEIQHSWDIQGTRVTYEASDTLTYEEGICYGKSHLLAALLRSQNIPTGFCYQRLMLFDTPEKVYCIHALNAIFLKTLNKWIRVDARGNKKGIDAQFTTDEEQLAFSPVHDYGELDYPTIYAKPHPKTVAVLKENTDAVEMYRHHLPEYL